MAKQQESLANYLGSKKILIPIIDQLLFRFKKILYIYPMKNILLILVLFCSFLTQAQTNDIPYVKKEFLIIHSGKDYAAALKKAIKICDV